MFTTPPSLLERLRQSSERAVWEKFVDLYTPLLFGWAAQLNLSPHDAADLVQDVFTVLLEKLPTFEYDPQKSFRAWLKTVLLNRGRNQLRQRRAEGVGDGRWLEAIADVRTAPDLGEEEYRRYVVGRALQLMQAEFQPATWRACWEQVVHQRPAADIAAELGISVNAVYLARGRVLRRLREELAGLLD